MEQSCPTNSTLDTAPQVTGPCSCTAFDVSQAQRDPPRNCRPKRRSTPWPHRPRWAEPRGVLLEM